MNLPPASELIQNNSLVSEELSSPKKRYEKTLNGEPVYVHRSDSTGMRYASLSLFPQEIALGLLGNYNKWSVVSEEMLHGLPVQVIEGDLNEYYQAKHQAKTFKLWVHKDTGILIKLEESNENKEVVAYLNTKSITFDENLDTTKFQIKAPQMYKALRANGQE